MRPGLRNPFPGLRPFEPNEDHLFFGREQEVDDLLRRLGSHRFLAVVGTSGSGKSSLVRSGLIPGLYSGLAIQAGWNWRIATSRPAEDPIGHLAAALDVPDVLGDPSGALSGANRVLLEATLRRGTLGLVEAVRHAHLPPDDAVLIVIDQFEELFRFRRSQVESSSEDAVAFVKLILQASRQTDLPIYVALTMRSDFIGDCLPYPGLPEAINDGLYLVPRMTRDELRSAIAGPVAVAGGRIAARLVLRLLNEVGDDQDQLPLLQHVLMRTWDHWAAHGRNGAPIDLEDYEAVGTLHHALSLHAEEAYHETGSEAATQTTERIFKALTDTFTDPRGVRRPTTVADLAAICEAPESRIVEIVDVFRRAGRSFLVPPASVPLTSRSIVDLSHESLMRCWTRLITWAQEERASAAQYVRLSREATWYHEGAAGLWTDPELELGLRWRRENRPTAAWAHRHDEAFDRAMDFLDRSEQERARLRAERSAQRVRYLQVAWGSAGVLLVLLIIASYFWMIARQESARAEQNLALAKDAVDQILLVSDRDAVLSGADLPQIDEFRRELLGRARGFYDQFLNQRPNSEEFLRELAIGHLRLGHINRLLEDPPRAATEYREAIERFTALAGDYPHKPEYRQSLASAHNWFGEAVRPFAERHSEAAEAFQNALDLQRELLEAHPDDGDYRQDLGRTHNNRGILLASYALLHDDASVAARADSDFREAIRLLEPLRGSEAAPQARKQLARVYNNLANLLKADEQRQAEGKRLYEQAIAIHAELVLGEPGNRETRFELATFHNNLAEVLRLEGDADGAVRANQRAVELIEDLVRAAPSLTIEQADAQTLRGRIVQPRDWREAAEAYGASLDLFRKLSSAADVARREDFHQRFGDLLVNLGAFCEAHPAAAASTLFSDGVRAYVPLAHRALAAGSRTEAQMVADNLEYLLPRLSGGCRSIVEEPYESLQQAFDGQLSGRR